MSEKSNKMNDDRTEGGRRKIGVNPSVACFSRDFSPKAEPPEPFSIDDLGRHALERGFRDGATKQSKAILERIGYQHASGYFNLIENSTGEMSMKHVHRLIVFDRKLQALLIEYIGLFELQFRAQYSYALSAERGAFAHRNPRNFKNPDYFNSFLESYQKEFNRQLRNRNKEISHAYEEYGDAPTWLAVEIMSFGTLSMLYKNTRSAKVRDAVASSFHADSEHFESWTRALSSIRNTCAHFGRLCGTRLVSKPKRIPDARGDNGSPFYAILLLVYMLSNELFFEDDPSLAYSICLLADAGRLFSDFDDVLKSAGIPPDWAELMGQKEVSGMPISDIGGPEGAKRGKITGITMRHPTNGNVVRL